MRFNEIWSIEPTVRLGKLHEQHMMHGTQAVFGAPARLRVGRPFPGTDNPALDPRIMDTMSRAPSIAVHQNWIVNPHLLYNDRDRNPQDIRDATTALIS